MSISRAQETDFLAFFADDGAVAVVSAEEEGRFVFGDVRVLFLRLKSGEEGGLYEGARFLFCGVEVGGDGDVGYDGEEKEEKEENEENGEKNDEEEGGV